MKSAGFVYHQPSSVDELLGLLAAHEDNRILAGGQSLMPMMNMRFVQPEHLIDANRVDGLNYIREESNWLRIGAMTRQKTLMQSDAVTRHCPLMRVALQHVGHFQTRNRGTIGGSLCHLDPAAELPLISLLYDASLTVRSAAETRTISASEWPLAYMLPAIGPDEALIEIALPVGADWTHQGFFELARRRGDFAIASAAVLLSISDGIIRKAAVALGAVTQTPCRLANVEALLVGQRADAQTIEAATAQAAKIEAFSDAYYSAQYRQRMAGVAVERALNAALGAPDHG